MNDLQSKMMLAEYEELAGHLRTFWTIRATVFGSGMTMICVLLALGAKAGLPAVGYWCVALQVILFAMTKVIGSHNRSLYIYTFRMREISDEFSVVGFWETWHRHVQERPQDSGSSSFFVLLRTFNLLLWLYTIGIHVYAIVFAELSVYALWVAGAAIILSFILMLLVHRANTREVRPSDFQSDLMRSWQKAKRNQTSACT